VSVMKDSATSVAKVTKVAENQNGLTKYKK